MTGKIMPLRERDTSTIQAAAYAFLSSPQYANPNTRRGYTGVLDRLLAGLGASRPLRGQRGGTGRPARATPGAAAPGDLEPPPRRRGRWLEPGWSGFTLSCRGRSWREGGIEG